MKKTILLLILLSTAIFAVGCQKQTLLNNVSELVETVWRAESENYVVKAQYGYRETPYVADGAVGTKTYALTLRLTPLKSFENAEYRASLSVNGTPYEVDFAIDPVRHKLSATVPAETCPEKEFDVKIFRADTEETLTLVCPLPAETLSPQAALDKLNENQSDLIDSYRTNGTFDAEITLRVFVNNDHPYWYVGLVQGEHKVVALLVDGITGEVLAIRELY